MQDAGLAPGCSGGCGMLGWHRGAESRPRGDWARAHPSEMALNVGCVALPPLPVASHHSVAPQGLRLTVHCVFFLMQT